MLKLHVQAPVLDSILDTWNASLGKDLTAYRHHCYRVLNFCLAFGGAMPDAISKASIAVAFHDLGIWVNNTYDYLGPSRQLALDYLAKTHQHAWCDEITAMIEFHHKITKYRGNPDWLVEPFRKADWVDVTRGKWRFGLEPAFIAEVISRFPNTGFHQRLVALTRQRFKTHPFSPLPMIKL